MESPKYIGTRGPSYEGQCDDEENWFIHFLRDGVKVAIKDFSMGFAAAQLYAVLLLLYPVPLLLLDINSMFTSAMRNLN